MENIDIKQLSYANRKAFEEHAHLLRAQAFRDAGTMVGKFFKAGFHKIGRSLTSIRRGWVGIRPEPIPPLKS